MGTKVNGLDISVETIAIGRLARKSRASKADKMSWAGMGINATNKPAATPLATAFRFSDQRVG